MSRDLETLMTYITSHYPFSPEKFPPLADYNDAQREMFVLNHLILHCAKTSGKLAAALEVCGHGGELDTEQLKEDAMKQIVTMLRLATVLGMTGAELEKRIESMYRDKE